MNTIGFETTSSRKEEWNTPQDEIKISINDVHVWLASVESPSGHLEYLDSFLSEDEILRADRFHFERDRRLYIAARGFLRIILGHYLDIEPGDLYFSYNRYGKPALDGIFLGDYLRFNISHSGEKILYAITLGREIGVDIEQTRPYENAKDIIERFFSEREKEEFRSLPEHLMQDVFFNCWTRKEAYIKARGKGMSLPLDEFSVSILPGEPARLVHIHGGDEEDTSWSLNDIISIDGYAAAVAVEGSDLLYKYMQCEI